MDQKCNNSKINSSETKNTSTEKSKYVKVRLHSPEENKANGFYLLMTNGNTYSDTRDEFVIERKFIDLLNEHNIKHNEVK